MSRKIGITKERTKLNLLKKTAEILFKTSTVSFSLLFITTFLNSK